MHGFTRSGFLPRQFEISGGVATCELVFLTWGCAQVVVRVRPTVSRPVDGKDLWFVRKTAPDSVAVGDRSFPVDGVLDDRASQVYKQA
jgi:hypothetical protein